MDPPRLDTSGFRRKGNVFYWGDTPSDELLEHHRRMAARPVTHDREEEAYAAAYAELQQLVLDDAASRSLDAPSPGPSGDAFLTQENVRMYIAYRALQRRKPQTFALSMKGFQVYRAYCGVRQQMAEAVHREHTLRRMKQDVVRWRYKMVEKAVEVPTSEGAGELNEADAEAEARMKERSQGLDIISEYQRQLVLGSTQIVTKADGNFSILLAEPARDLKSLMTWKDLFDM